VGGGGRRERDFKVGEIVYILMVRFSYRYNSLTSHTWPLECGLGASFIFRSDVLKPFFELHDWTAIGQKTHLRERQRLIDNRIGTMLNMHPFTVFMCLAASFGTHACKGGSFIHLPSFDDVRNVYVLAFFAHSASRCGRQ
jgi:hypothetical protein